MKKILSVFLSALMIASSFAMAASALTPAESQSAVDAAYNAMFDGVAGDVNGDGAFTVTDARAALLSSAGLDKDTVNKAKADTDGDGVITAIDARTILRAAAKLESIDVLYTPQMKLDLFNALLNNIKYSGEKYRRFKTDETVSVTHDNQAAIDDFNKQMNNLMKIAGSNETIDLGKELTSSSDNAPSYSYSSRDITAAINNYPVSGQEFASIIGLGDIVSIAYTENQTYVFAPKRNYGSPIEPLTMTGLDALTITVKDEKLTNIPADTTKTAHGKCFDIPSKEEIMSGYADINEQFKSLDFSSLGEGYIFDVNAGFNSINYHTSSITIYFKHDTKEVCLISYELNYDLSVAVHMNIDMGIFLSFKNQTINITDSEKQTVAYYFPAHYPYPTSN